MVRNSWGSNWGLDGYFKIARNKNSMCGIGTYGYYTLVLALSFSIPTVVNSSSYAIH